jgi:hypothetical protein
MLCTFGACNANVVPITSTFCTQMWALQGQSMHKQDPKCVYRQQLSGHHKTHLGWAKGQSRIKELCAHIMHIGE